MHEENPFRAFVDTVFREDIAAMKSMIAAGYDPDTINENGETAFSYAWAHNKLASAQFLHGIGVNINTCDKGGGTRSTGPFVTLLRNSGDGFAL
jgi:ankyrin repeat protein